MGKVKNLALTVKGMWNKPLEGKFLCIKEIGALGLYALSTSSFYNLMLFYLVTIIFIPYYYNIESIHAYIILILGNALNMMLQPVIGNAMEKTKTKIGRYKPYVLGLLPFLIVCTILATLVPQGLNETENIIYAYCTCVPSIFLTSFAFNMYQTMPTVITPNSQERDDVMTPIGLIFGLAPSIMTLIIGPIRSAFAGREYWAIRLLGIIVAIVGGLGMLFILRLRERVVQVDVRNEDADISMGKAVKMLAKNKPLMIMSFALCLGSLREFWRYFQQFFAQTRFSADINLALDVMGVPMTVMALGCTIAMLVMPILTRKLNKNAVIIILTAFNFVCCLIAGLIGFQNVPIGILSIVEQTILFLVASIGNGVVVMIPMLIGDIADYQQSISGKRLEGHIQNFLITIPLLFSQVVMLGLSFWQKAIGFEPKDYSTDVMVPLPDGSLPAYSATQQGIANQWFNIVCIICAISSALMMFVLFFYPLSKKKHQEAVDKIAIMNGKTPSDGIEDIENIDAAANDAIIKADFVGETMSEDLSEKLEDSIDCCKEKCETDDKK